MRLKDIISEGTFSRGSLEKVLTNVASLLQNQLGVYLDRVGGAGRTYEIDGVAGSRAAIYIIKGTTKAISLAWLPTSSTGLRVTTIDLWRNFNFYSIPDFTISLPPGINFVQLMDTVVSVIKNPKPGEVELLAPHKQVDEMASRTTIEDFAKMVLSRYGKDKIGNLSWVDIQTVATENDVQVPTMVRLDRTYKVKPNIWTLEPALGASVAPDTSMNDFAKQTGAQTAEPEMMDTDVASLASIKTMSRMASKGKLHVMGRNSQGHFYKVPNIEHVLSQMERMIERIKQFEPDGGLGMEEQYDDLKEKVRLVAGEQARYIRSVLITGMPSSGKSHTIMNTLKEMGLIEGEDFTVLKGKVTTYTLHRTLVENHDRLTVFDDCDSVWKDANAVNILKAALDTGDVREITYNVGRTLNTASMTREERDEIVNMVALKLKGKWEEPETQGDDEDENYSFEQSGKKEKEAFDGDISGVKLPNKIDFKGKIIFISNLDESELDEAVKTRAFIVNLNFKSLEMLNFIDKIKGKIRHSISEEQKQEVIDFIRDLYTTGRLRRQVNFRLIQQAFDLRTTSNWQRLIASL